VLKFGKIGTRPKPDRLCLVGIQLQSVRLRSLAEIELVESSALFLLIFIITADRMNVLCCHHYCFLFRRNTSRGQNSDVNTSVCSMTATVHTKPLRPLNY